MAKQSNKVKHTQVTGQNEIANQIEQSVSIDDSLLPDAEELTKLKLLDPNIIEWLKARAEKEQDMRHRYMDAKIDISKGSMNKSFTIDLIILIISFALLAGGMTYSYFLIIADKILPACILGGTTLVFAVNSILNFRKVVSVTKKK